MNIYKSSQVRPYVYLCIHKITKQFYIGYREKNVKLNVPSDIDLPMYRTSCNIVRNNFDEYDWIILAEFNTGDDAYNFEQFKIFESWCNPLLLNKSHRFGKAKFKNKFHSEETKKKMSAVQCGRNKGRSYEEIYGKDKAVATKNKIRTATLLRTPPSNTTKQKIRNTLTGHLVSVETKKKISSSLIGSQNNLGNKASKESKKKMSNSHLGKRHSEETKNKMRGRVPWNKGMKTIPCCLRPNRNY